jgi:hypothetical protein
MFDRIQAVLAKLQQELGADRKKAAIMVILLLVLVFAIGRVLLSNPGAGSAGAAACPAAAVASDAPAAPVAPLVRPVPESSPPPSAQSAPSAVIRLAATLAANAGSRRRDVPAGDLKAREAAVAELPRTMVRDVFVSAVWSQLQNGAGAGVVGDEAQNAESAGPSLWERMRGALGEQRERHAREVMQITTELTQLNLQSTLSGPVPSAYISGRLVHEKDTIDGFSVVRITEKQVKLRKNGITRSLVMP